MEERALDETTQEIAYALHTASCTYLLTDEGVCRWIVSPRGAVPSHVQQAVGAQFVACLDPAVAGSLVGSLRLGATALFVRQLEDRMVLLRTAPIVRLDDRSGEALPAESRSVAAPTANHRSRAYGRGGVSGAPPPSFGIVKNVGQEQTITISRATLVRKGHREG
jgi:hypothetical protein